VQVNDSLMAMISRAPLLTLAGCAAAPPVTSDIPAPLRVAGSALVIRQTHGVGAQIYRCRADKDDPTRFAWALKEPEAELFDRSGIKLGKHYAGPTWEANDGSKVTGEVVARANSFDSNAVPWLKLNAKTTSGPGIFATVRFIQRLHTVGGNAPLDGCNADAADREVRVSYSADYWFYADKP
jgi:hypothetical protein